MTRPSFSRKIFNMLTIRLQRVGRTNQAAFRIVLAEKHRAASKKVVEVLGHYDPRTKEFGLKDPERLKYWVAQHVELSPTAHNLLVTKGLVEGKKVKAWRPKPKPAEASAEAGVKAKEEVKAETKPVGAEAKAPEAKAEPAPAAPTAEAPKEEPKAEKSEEAKPAA
ncbi:MAG: 30S ribosomal protein S16 [Parcubacteria group bacterium GW2011_GWA2_52_8]|nr:MAG: 30S ribosomal protein S16 [Parcubacteria group bacterium GW2011_GWA2_52_8]